jgi:hypothetical protein
MVHPTTDTKNGVLKHTQQDIEEPRTTTRPPAAAEFRNTILERNLRQARLGAKKNHVAPCCALVRHRTPGRAPEGTHWNIPEHLPNLQG